MAALSFKLLVVDDVIALQIFDLNDKLKKPFVFTASNGIRIEGSIRPGLDKDLIKIYTGDDVFYKNKTVYHNYSGTKPHLRVKKYMVALKEFVEAMG